MCQAQKCLYLSCRNPTTNPTGFCYSHEHLSFGVTPGGQYANRRTNGADLSIKLAKEGAIPIPEDSAKVPGYPYFTKTDLVAYRYFIQTGDERYRPSALAIVDRFPVIAKEVDGDSITGLEVGVYGGKNDDLYTFDQAVPLTSRSSQISDDVRMFSTGTGATFMVKNSRKYQVVLIDEQSIASL